MGSQGYARSPSDVAEIFAKRQLRKGGARELIEAGKAAQFVIAADRATHL